MKKWTKQFGIMLSLAAALTVSGTAAGAAPDTSAPSRIASYGADYLIKTDGSLWVWGGNRSVPTQVAALQDVEAAFNSQAGSFAVKKDRSVWKLETSATTLATTATPVQEPGTLKQLFSLSSRTVAVSDDGTLSSSIRSFDNQTARSTDSAFTRESGIDNVAAVDGYYESNKSKQHWQRFLFLKKDGTVWTTFDDFATFTQVPGLTDVTHLQQNYALRKDGTLWTWPIQNEYEPETLGDPSVVTPAAVSSLPKIRSIRNNGISMLAIDGQSNLWFWGATITGVSDGTTYHQQAVPVRFTAIKNVTDAYIVERSIVALTSGGKVYAASIDGESMNPNADFGLLASEITSIQGSGRHVIMQKTDGTLWGWGINKNAQLGNGEYEFNYPAPVAMQKPIAISLNGENVSLTNGVITRNGQNFIPLRSLFDKLGATVAYKEDIKTVPAGKDKPGGMISTVDKKVTITRNAADKPALSITINTVTGATTVNDKSVTLPTPPFIVSGTVYLPLRFISEQLGASVNWLPQQETIAITMK
ncbi:stalk domain-containing protein [Paenibacillus sp. BAC0078]